MEAIFSRTSIRKYEERPVEEAKIEKLLRAAMAAPSAANQQPWEFYVVTDKEKLQALSQASQYAGPVANAPLAIVPCYNREKLIFADYADIDMSAATENLLLEAEEQGLGAVWLGIAPLADRMAIVAEILALPPSLAAFQSFRWAIRWVKSRSRIATIRNAYIGHKIQRILGGMD